MAENLYVDDRGVSRCRWCAGSTDYIEYHDKEWGFPVTDDQRLFEKVCLEGFQAGLSWLTILRKREAFRKAFRAFAFDKVGKFGDADVVRLLGDAGIVRHRGKIESVIHNAKQARALTKEFGSLAEYFWQWKPIDAGVAPMEQARALSKDLKKRGWTFVGPTTIYAFMQAMGLVNDHDPGCSVYSKVASARRRMKALR